MIQLTILPDMVIFGFRANLTDVSYSNSGWFLNIVGEMQGLVK